MGDPPAQALREEASRTTRQRQDLLYVITMAVFFRQKQSQNYAKTASPQRAGLAVTCTTRHALGDPFTGLAGESPWASH